MARQVMTNLLKSPPVHNNSEKPVANLKAPDLVLQPVSVTRKMSASLPRLREIAQRKGLKIHQLCAGYPHPEVTDPRGFIDHQNAYFAHLQQIQGLNEHEALPENQRESFTNGDT